MEGVVVVVFLVVLGGQVDREIFRGVEEQAAAHGVGIAVVDVVAGEEVLAVAVTLFFLERQSGCYAVAEAAADRTFKIHLRVVAHRDAGVAVEFLRGALGDQVHGAGGGAAAVERALRAAQHFHTLQVIEACHLRGRARQDGAVLVHRHRTVGAEVDAGHADAADEDPRHTELVAHREVRDGVHHVADVGDAAGGEGVSAHHRDGGCGGGHRGLLLGGGDHHFLDVVRGFRVRAGRRDGDGKQAEARDPREQVLGVSGFHAFLLG